jgi:hypothetical protein
MTDGVDWLRDPDGRGPGRIIPVHAPDEIAGFRFPTTADGVGKDGKPVISAERGHVNDPAERERLLDYLAGGALVLETMSYGVDRLDPTRRHAVQYAYRTDGAWIWPAAVEYYLRQHQVAPAPAFRRWIAEHDYRMSPVPADVLARAREAVQERADVLTDRVAGWKAEHPQETLPENPFPPDVNEALTALGWRPGRDVRDRVDAWLAGWVDDLAELPFERDGYRRYEPIPAALAVLNEFGGIDSLANGPGQTSAQIPFSIYPSSDNDDLMRFALDVAMLGDRIDQRVFQIGDVERRMGALVVDDTGRVFAVGPVELYLGKDIQEALMRMLRGIRAEQLHEIGL